MKKLLSIFFSAIMIAVSLYLCIYLNDKTFNSNIHNYTKVTNTSLLSSVKNAHPEEINKEDTEEHKTEKVEEKIVISNSESNNKIQEKEEELKEVSTVVEENSKKTEEIKTGTIDSVYVGLRFTGSMSAYGRDCCGSNPGMTSSGFDLKTSLYYYDSTYGNLRVLASDTNFKLYSVIKVSDPRDGTYNAIVLDRAGSVIGLNKPKKFDLAVESEAYASNNYGIHNNITFEVLRVGR